MIRITIELLPKGSETHKRHLGTMEIANIGGTLARGNYRVRLSIKGKPERVWKRGTVINFPRRKLGPYDLLFRALEATVGERNSEAKK